MGPMSSRAVLNRLAALFALLMVLTLVAGAVGLTRMRAITRTIDTVMRDRMVPIEQLRTIQAGYALEPWSAVSGQLQGSVVAADALARLDRLAATRSRLWSDYLQTELTEEEKRLVARTEPLLLGADSALQRARTLIQRGSTAELRRFLDTELRGELEPALRALDELMALQVEVAQSQARAARRAYDDAVWALVFLATIAIVGGGALAYVAVAVHVRERGEAASAAQRQAVMYRALSGTNRALMHAGDPATLLRDVARTCAQTGLVRATAIFVRGEGSSATRAAAEGDGAAYYADKVHLDLSDALTRETAAGRVLTTGQRVVWQDYQKGSAAREWREEAERLGIRSVAAFPIRRGGEVVGAMVVQASTTGFFTDELVELFDEMVNEIAFALDHLDHARQARESLEHFQLLFQKSPVATVIVDQRDNRIVEVNDTLCERYGLTREQMRGHTMRELNVGVIDEDRARLIELRERYGKFSGEACRVRVADGSIRHSLITADALRYQGRDCYIYLGLDITERHNAEMARRDALAAELANRSKTEFLSRMSHELRTPLNAVLGFSELLLSDERARLGARQKMQVGHIHKAGTHLLQLINDVLDIARIESGSMHVTHEPVAVGDLLGEVVRMSEPLALKHGIALRYLLQHGASFGVLGDPIRLRQVLLNLISNGIKYNRPGGSVRIELIREDAGEDEQVHIDVIDSGIGMTREQLDHLYEPFNRLGRERGGIEGSGIGLAITLQLVKLMGGSMAVTSEAGEGTQVRVSLRGAQLPPPAPALRDHEATDTEQVSGSVLYIEDNLVNSVLVEQMLSRWPGVKLSTRPDGASGIAAALELQPDLVLLDLQLPDMSGVQVLQALRKDARSAGLRIVALSASAMPEEVEAARGAGASDYWTKPLELEAFTRNVAGLLRAGRRMYRHLRIASEACLIG